MGQQQRAGGVGAARSVYHLQRCPCHRPCQPVPFWGSASCSGCSEPMPPTPAVSSESRASPAQDLARFPGRGARQGSHPCPPLPIASSISSKQLPGIAPTTQVHPCCPPRRRQALLVPAARQQHHQPHLPQSQAEAACPEARVRGAEHPPKGDQVSGGCQQVTSLPVGEDAASVAAGQGWMHTSTFHWAEECGGMVTAPRGCECVCMRVHQANVLLAVTITSL